MSDLNQFVTHFKNSFNPPVQEDLSPDTVFKELEAWSSMQALVLIAMVDSEYDVLLDGDEIQQSKTLEALFSIIQEKKS